MPRWLWSDGTSTLSVKKWMTASTFTYSYLTPAAQQLKLFQFYCTISHRQRFTLRIMFHGKSRVLKEWMNLSLFTDPSTALWCVHCVSSKLSFIDFRFYISHWYKHLEVSVQLYFTLMQFPFNFILDSCNFCHRSCLFPVKLVPLICQVEERLLENSTLFQQYLKWLSRR